MMLIEEDDDVSCHDDITTSIATTRLLRKSCDACLNVTLRLMLLFFLLEFYSFK